MIETRCPYTLPLTSLVLVHLAKYLNSEVVCERFVGRFAGAHVIQVFGVVHDVCEKERGHDADSNLNQI